MTARQLTALLSLAAILWSATVYAQQRTLSAQPASGGQRLALVIGNDAYQKIPALRNARADARAMAQALQQTGFEVILRLDQTERQLRESVRNFKARLNGGSEAVFYFAGHGVQLGSANYLLPVDVAGENEDQVKDDAMPLQRVLDDLADQKVRFSLAIVDACRNNPFRTAGRAIGGRGLAPTNPATGQMVLYSAGAGQTALDRLTDSDRDPNGLFTRVLLKEMQRPGVSVDRVLRNVRDEVVRMAKTVGHEQVPALYDQAIGEFYFQPGQATAPTASTPSPPMRIQSAEEIEQELWNSIKESRNPKDFQEYIEAYPSGRFAITARARLRAVVPAPQEITVPARSQAGSVPAELPQQLASIATTLSESQCISLIRDGSLKVDDAKNFVGAVEDLKRAIAACEGKLRPDWIRKAYVNLGLAYVALEDWESSLRASRASLRYGESWIAYTNIARALSQNKGGWLKNPEAMLNLQKAIQIAGPKSAPAVVLEIGRSWGDYMAIQGYRETFE